MDFENFRLYWPFKALLKNTLATLVYIPGAAAMPQFTIPLLTSPQIQYLKGQSQKWQK
jgi:hypothetical protein